MKNLCKIFFLCYMQRTEKVQDRKTITYIIQMNAFEKFFVTVHTVMSREVFSCVFHTKLSGIKSGDILPDLIPLSLCKY